MDFTRNLRKWMSGDDVVFAKKRLVELGYLRAAEKRAFGNETFAAVKDFQKANGLEADGVIGVLTWAALFGSPSEETHDTSANPTIAIPERFSAKARQEIGIALSQVSDIRREIVLDALQFAAEAENKPQAMTGFYIRGGNLYNKDLSLNVMTEAKLKTYFRRSEYAPYFDGGRDELMMENAMHSMFKIAGCDCSGLIVGLMRKHGVYDAGFDGNANTLGASHVTRTTNPQAGDWCCKSGHIGLYAGGGWELEAAGGAYGIQLSKNRRVYNFLSGQINKLSKWEFYGDPKRY